MRPSAPILQAYNTQPRKIHGKTFGPNWFSLDMSFAEIGWFSTIATNCIVGPLNGITNRLSYGDFPSDKDPEYFADTSNITWNPPTIHCSDLTATAPQMSLPWFCVLLYQQYHLFLICVALTYNDSRIIPHKTCQIPRNCQYKWLLASSSAPGTFASFSGFLVKFWSCTDMPGSIGWLSPAPRLHIGDCFEIHNFHW